MSRTNLSIVDVVNLFFLALNIVFYIVTFNRTPYQLQLSVLYLFCFFIILFAGRVRGREPEGLMAEVFYLAYPVLFLFTIFESFFMILPYFNTLRYDELLTRVDYNIFGCNPTVWIERFVSPWLTDVMYFFYLFYFPMPLIVLGTMLKKKKLEDIEEAIFIFLSCYYAAYAIYYFIPASGPRFHLGALQRVGLDGYVLALPIKNFIDMLEPNKLDAFPSLHAAILLITMRVAREHEKKLFYIFMPVAVIITVSLVYCRYHYVIDIIAGFLLAEVTYRLAERVHGRLRKKCAPHFGAIERRGL